MGSTWGPPTPQFATPDAPLRGRPRRAFPRLRRRPDKFSESETSRPNRSSFSLRDCRAPSVNLHRLPTIGRRPRWAWWTASCGQEARKVAVCRRCWHRLFCGRQPGVTAPARRNAERQSAGAWHSRATVWVRPELVAEIEYRGWTENELLRHPSFKGLREDE